MENLAHVLCEIGERDPVSFAKKVENASLINFIGIL